MKRNRIFKDTYSVGELRVLVEEYEELNDLRSKSWIQVRLMDTDQAYAALRPKHKVAVFLLGFAGIASPTAARLVGETDVNMRVRYYRGLVEMATYLNGGA